MELKDFVMSSPLNKRVFEIVLEGASCYGGGTLKERIMHYCDEVTSYGCQSGMISELVYYSDTSAWFEEFYSDIAELVDNLCNDTGCSIGELVSGWNSGDPFCRDIYNKNLIAWLSFEETCRYIHDILEGM